MNPFYQEETSLKFYTSISKMADKTLWKCCLNLNLTGIGRRDFNLASTPSEWHHCL